MIVLQPENNEWPFLSILLLIEVLTGDQVKKEKILLNNAQKNENEL